MKKVAINKIVVVTQKTALEELGERYNTREQAQYYLEHMGISFHEYQAAHDQYHSSLASLRGYLPPKIRSQWIERSFLPNFLFDPLDIVVTLGRDGLVVNTGKYLDGQPLIAFNPDPQRIDGVLVPFDVSLAAEVLHSVLDYDYRGRFLTLAKATLNDGQKLYAVNDLFIGRQTHVSARYRLRFGDRVEDQSSSGIIVSTGAGSTGWLRSVLTGAAGVVEEFAPGPAVQQVRNAYAFDASADRLCFSVREPFVSRVTSAEIVFGALGPHQTLEIVSGMPQGGVIFSDGVESDFLRFESGAIARIEIAEKKIELVCEVDARHR
jgi:NAD kinase